MKLVTSSEYEVFNNYETRGNLVKEAINTYYPMQEKLNKTKLQLIDFAIEQNNLSLLEFCWYPILIRISKPTPEKLDMINSLASLFNTQKYLNFLIVDEGVIVSGNGRAWYECLEIFKSYGSKELKDLLKLIYNQLHSVNPSIFNYSGLHVSDDVSVSILTKDQINLKEKTLNDNPFITNDKIRDKHDWLAVKFLDVSKDFVSEILEHRVFSFSLRKDYFSMEKDFGFMVDNDAVSLKSDFKIIEDCLNEVQKTYNYLINKGHRRDVVKQLLPSGITKEILVASNIEGWKNLFKSKTCKDSYWEIKTILNDLKAQLNEFYGYNF